MRLYVAPCNALYIATTLCIAIIVDVSKC